MMTIPHRKKAIVLVSIDGNQGVIHLDNWQVTLPDASLKHSDQAEAVS